MQRALYVRPGTYQSPPAPWPCALTHTHHRTRSCAGPLAQLISFAQRSGDPAFLKQSLAALSKVRMGNTVGYASLVSTLSATNNLDEMFFVYARMKEERVPLNIYSASALINTSLRHNKLERYTPTRAPPRAMAITSLVVPAHALGCIAGRSRCCTT